MNAVKKVFSVALMMLVMLAFGNVQTAEAGKDKGKNDKWETAYIKTNAQCDMCKERIEKAVYKQKGVRKAELNMKNKAVMVVYNTKKTDIDNIRTAISDLGHQADGVKANQAAYEALPDCCKTTKKSCSKTCTKPCGSK